VLGRTLVLGLARSGEAAAAALERRGVEVRRVDRSLGDDTDPTLLDGVELIVKSPGVPKEHPLVATARVPVWSEVELGARLLPVRLAGVTGTNGKTTTSELLGAMLGAKVAGNVGRALTELDGQVDEGELVVVELSSFQLEDVHELRCDVAAELMHVLELETRQLDDNELPLVDLPVQLGECAPHVAGDLRAEHRPEQLARRGLPVRARDAGEAHGQEPSAELDLAPDRDAGRGDERVLLRHAGALDDQLDAVEERRVGVVAERAVDAPHLHPTPLERGGGRLAGAGEPEDERTAEHASAPREARAEEKTCDAARGRPCTEPPRCSLRQLTLHDAAGLHRHRAGDDEAGHALRADRHVLRPDRPAAALPDRHLAVGAHGAAAALHDRDVAPGTHRPAAAVADREVAGAHEQRHHALEVHLPAGDLHRERRHRHHLS